MKEIALITSLLSAATGVLSTLALIKGTTPVPWGLQSWGGESEPERAFRRRSRRWLVSGLCALAAAFALAAASSVAGYWA